MKDGTAAKCHGKETGNNEIVNNEIVNNEIMEAESMENKIIYRNKRGCKAVFLDRDGTINVEKHYLYKTEQFEYRDGAVEGMRALETMGFSLVVITNQSGIARGYYTEKAYKKLEQWMIKDLAQRGVTIEKVYYCPHLPDALLPEYRKDCRCRKPGTGLFWQACKELVVDMDSSFVVGDRMRDLCICQESGVRGILMTKKTVTKEELWGGDIFVCSDWYQVIERIRQQCRNRELEWKAD